MTFNVVHHVHFNTFAHSELFQVGQFGLPVPRCAVAAAAIAIMHMALQTVTSLRVCIPAMWFFAEENILVRTFLSSGLCLYPEFRDAPSFAETLQGESLSTRVASGWYQGYPRCYTLLLP